MNVLRALCVIAAVAMWLVAVLCYGASVRYAVMLAVFAIFFVQLPGLFLVSLCGFKGNHLSTDMALGLFAGWGLNVLVYFISDLIPNDFLIYIAGPLLSLVYIYRLAVKKQKPLVIKRFRFSKLSIALCLFAVLVLFYCFTGVQYRYLAPALSDFTIMNSDKAYHMGLINSLSHDYPMESPWVSGKFITYHIFSEILLSIPVRLFSIPSDVMMLSFGPIWTSYTFGLSLYSFFKEMSRRPERAGAYSLLLLLSNIYITRDASTSIAFRFALENDNASGYGISIALMTIVVFKKWYEAFTAKDPTRFRQLAALMAFTMLATGIKGPMGAVIVAAMWGTMLLGFILRKVPFKAVAPLAAVTAVFVFVYMTVLSGRGVSNATGQSIFAFAKIADIAFWKKPLIAAMQGIGIPTPIRLLVVLAVFILFMTTIYFVPFCIGYVRELILVVSGRKHYEPHRVLVYAAAMVGFILMMIMNYSGHSQIYFGLVTVFLVPIIATWFIEDLEDRRDTSALAKHTLRVTVSVMALTVIATTVSLGSFLSENIYHDIRAANPHRSPDKYTSISNDEYEAMVWLSENTEFDSLLATDRYYSVPLEKYHVDNRWDNRFFLYAVYSNRFTYISGSGYNIPDRDYELRRTMLHNNNELYDPENEDRGDKARELGVDYVVVSKRFTEIGDLTNEDYEKCFSNDEIDIYKIAG
jgi:hypothetical protein